MPVSLSYPGVYIEEIPSGVRTISGVSTSIAAFVGRAKQGLIDKATVINSYADYERTFGGLDLNSRMSFAVRDFFLNGGNQAVIVRIYHADTPAEPGEEVRPAVASLTAGNVPLVAASPGAWANVLRVIVHHPEDAATAADVAERQGVEVEDLFNITVEENLRTGGRRERFLNVTVVPGPRRLDKVLEKGSDLVQVARIEDSELPDLPETRPDAGAYTVTEGNRASDGQPLDVNDYVGDRDGKKGLYALEQIDLFNLLCLPPDGQTQDYPVGLLAAAASYCEERRAMLLVDPPSNWTNKENAKTGMAAGVGTNSKNAAIFFPRLKQPNPLRDNQIEEFVPCGAVAGIFARTDAQRGVWKAPAGIEATLRGVPELRVNLTDAENGELNPLGLNCLRAFPVIGRVVWGARTLRGADQLADEWKYIPVRRLALFIEESLYRGTQWVVFEPNDEPLWGQIRLNVGAFMNNLFRQGAFQGASPREAYFVKCDKESTTHNDINLGIVNVVVGFAPLKPAEFVVLKIQQIAGQVQI